MVSNSTKPECPIDPVRMAWPFKTDEERELLREWYKRTEQFEKQFEKKRREEVLDKAERALL